MKNMNIPWAVPNFQEADKGAIQRVLDSGWLSMGKEVSQFEDSLSDYLDISYGIAVNSGTAALDIALKSIGITSGDEVIIPTLTYIATGNAVLYNNGTPVFVDIDDTLNIDPSLIEEKITDKTKAIINIDLGGNPSNYAELIEISKQYNVDLVVDGAQSLGSEHHGVKCCTHGIVNTTSFHSAKILTTVEGGMIFTREKDIYLMAQAIRNQGETAKYQHSYLGNNYRMTDIAASIGNSQLERFDETLKQRKLKVDYYKENLKNVEWPRELPNTVNCNFFFLILVENRDKLIKYLDENGIDTRITYPMPLNEQPVFRPYSKEVFHIAKKLSKKVISLPLYHELKREEQDYIIEKINMFVR